MECAVKGARAGFGSVATAVFIRAARSTICAATMTSGALIASRHLAFRAGDTKVIQGASPAFGLGSEEVSMWRIKDLSLNVQIHSLFFFRAFLIKIFDFAANINS